MKHHRVRMAGITVVVVFLLLGSMSFAQKSFTIEQILSYSFPSDLVSAKKADRIAWCEVEKGLRNVYTAVAPGFKPVRLTDFMQDDGKELSELKISYSCAARVPTARAGSRTLPASLKAGTRKSGRSTRGRASP